MLFAVAARIAAGLGWESGALDTTTLLMRSAYGSSRIFKTNAQRQTPTVPTPHEVAEKLKKMVAAGESDAVLVIGPLARSIPLLKVGSTLMSR